MSSVATLSTHCLGGFGGDQRRRNHSWEEKATRERQPMELVTREMGLLMLKLRVLGGSSHFELVFVGGNALLL